MRIVDLIPRGMIIPRLASTGKSSVIEELATHMAGACDSIEGEALIKVLSDREALASTAIGEGVAIPHGKLASMSNIVACLGRSRDGIDFESMDGKATHLFIVLVAPENSTGMHLKALARISRVFKDSDFLKRLLEAENADSMYEILLEEDTKY